jgi:hypothetical protein
MVLMVFRRRPLGPRSAGVRPRRIQRTALRQLRIAHRFMEHGQWSQAAEIFGRLAAAAEGHGLQQAPQLYLLESRARIENGETAFAVKQLHHAVQLFSRLGQTQRLAHIRPRLIEELKQHGLERDAVELDRGIHDLLDRQDSPGTNAITGRVSTRLPAKCRACGGTLRSDEIEWFDEHAGACPYCGSVAQVE